jgi:CBS domain-containing protein
MQATPKDVLTPDVVRVTEDMEVRAVARLLGHEAIAGAPVVDGEGHVVGLISQRDLLDHALTPFPEGLPATTVRDIMTPVAVTVGEDIPLN